jgi:hypothetical protein
MNGTGRDQVPGPWRENPPMLTINFVWLAQAAFSLLMRELRERPNSVPCAPCARAAAAKLRDQALGKEKPDA